MAAPRADGARGDERRRSDHRAAPPRQRAHGHRGIVPDAVLDALTERDRRVYWDSLLARRDGELYLVNVHTAAQRQGIGRALMRAVAMWLAADGIETLRVWVACANRPARRFYAALGAGTLPEVARYCRASAR
jgi:GNAT superfamily N-acetyltransferase